MLIGASLASVAIARAIESLGVKNEKGELEDSILRGALIGSGLLLLAAQGLLRRTI